MLILRHHGGQCCGVMHIQNFPSQLNSQQAASDGKPPPPAAGHTGIIGIKAPAEPATDRLDRLLAWRDQYLTYNITEVLLAGYQYHVWDKFLISRGFEMVGDCFNSNSHNRIYHYLRVKDHTEESKKKFEKIRTAISAEKAKKDAAKKAAEEAAKKAVDKLSEAAKKGWVTRKSKAAAHGTGPRSCSDCVYGVEPSRIVRGLTDCASCSRKKGK